MSNMLAHLKTNPSDRSLISANLLTKFAIYVKKYGFIQTIFSYIGRSNQKFWHIFGWSVTRSYLNKWLSQTKAKIVNLGGGSNCLENCLTVDINPRADVYVDITKKLPFDDSSIDAIFCEEAIEHISLELGFNLLKECWRILKPGGILRITTPDLNWFADRISISPLACDEINKIFYEHKHCYLYSQQALQFYSQKAGFVDLFYSKYKDINSKLGYLDSHAERFNHLPEMSQYLEVKKPKN